jgi:hypothetical protein
MTRTGYLALIVLVALVAGILGYKLLARNAREVADSQSSGESTREANGQWARPLSHGPRSGGDEHPGPGERRIAPQMGGDRRAAPGTKSEEAIRAHPEPRLAWKVPNEGMARNDSEPDGEAPRDGTVSLTNGVAREVAPPKAGRQPGGAAPNAAQAVEQLEKSPDAAASEVLLSIPLHGAVEPEQGAGPAPQTSGLVTNGGQVEFTEDAQYTMPAGGNVNSAAGTISFTIQPNWAGSDDSNNSLLQIRDEHQWEDSLGIVKNYNSLRYVIRDDQGVESNVNIYIDDWQPNEPHVVTATWDDQRMTLSVDGAQVGESPLPNPLRFGETTPMHIGSDFPGSTYSGANARISDLTVRSTAPTSAATP